MILKYLLSLFAFFRLSVVEDGVGAVTATDDKADAKDPVTPESAVLTELGLNEESDSDTSSVSQEAKADVAPEPAKDAVKTELAKTAEEESKAQDAEKAKAEAAKTITDADLAPLESKNHNTNERFRKVTEGYKQEKQRADAAAADVEKYKSSFDSLKQLGFNDEHAADDLVALSGYRNVMKTGNVDLFKQTIEAQIKQFEQLHGKRVTVAASALDDHPDLQKQVTELSIPENVAMELAQKRAGEAREVQARKAREEQQASNQQHEAVMNDAIANVNAMEANWKKTDPDAAVLLPHLKAHMVEIAQKFPPSQWPSVIEMQYKSLKKALGDQANNDASTTARPLRAAGHTAGLLEPTNPQDAVLQALGLDN